MQIKYKIVHVCSVPSQRYQPIPIPFSLLALIKLVNKRNRVVLCILLRLIKQFLWSQSTHNLSFIKFIAVANKHFASQNGRKISCDFHVILILGRKTAGAELDIGVLCVPFLYLLVHEVENPAD